MYLFEGELGKQICRRATLFSVGIFLPGNSTKIPKKKSRIRETPTLSTNADRRTDTNLKRLRDSSKKIKKFKKMTGCVIFLKKNKKKKRKITQPLQICIGPSIRIGRESWCLPYAGFFSFYMFTFFVIK